MFRFLNRNISQLSRNFDGVFDYGNCKNKMNRLCLFVWEDKYFK